MCQTLSACMTASYEPGVSQTSAGHQNAVTRKIAAHFTPTFTNVDHGCHLYASASSANAGAGISPCHSLTMNASPRMNAPM